MPYYCWISKPGQVARAVINLERQRFDVFVPTYRTKEGKINNLFGRYGFIEIAEDAHWRPVLSTLGVSGLVQFAGIPAKVPASLVQRLREAQSTGEMDERQPPSPFVSGAAVRVTAGPFGGIIGKFMSATSTERCRILLQMLGGPVITTMAIDNVVPLN